MTAYYNEIDPYCVQWLRNLIDAKLIAPGIVDDRPIQDVRPVDLASFTQCHFFAGLGGWSAALRLADIPDHRPLWTGSCPCQPFSAAGQRRGFADERHLWPYWQYLIAQRRPATILGEQVASATQWLQLVRSDLEALGYAVGAIPIEAASAVRTISEIDSGLWPTARVTQNGGHGSPLRSANHKPRLEDCVQPSMRSTIRATDGQKGGPNMRFGAGGTPLPTQAFWATATATATATARDHKDNSFTPNVPINGLLGRQVWPTPTSSSPATETYNEAGNSAGLVAIRKHAIAALYPTPTVAEMKTGCGYGSNNGRDFPTLHGATGASPMRGGLNGSSVPMERRGALNPEFVCWLMGYRPEWLSCAPSATPSTRVRRQRSSELR